jgi:hypothetical protein
MGICRTHPDDNAGDFNNNDIIVTGSTPADTQMPTSAMDAVNTGLTLFSKGRVQHGICSCFVSFLFPISWTAYCMHSEIRVTHIAHVIYKNGNVVYNTR